MADWIHCFEDCAEAKISLWKGVAKEGCSPYGGFSRENKKKQEKRWTKDKTHLQSHAPGDLLSLGRPISK
jgi:hypothetical protein